MEKINKKCIPYKTDVNRQSTHVLIGVTEGLKKSIKDRAKEEGVTMSEMLRNLALNNGPALEEVKKKRKPRKKLVWNASFGGVRAYKHTMIWHDVKAEVPEDAAQGYDIDMNVDGCKLLLLVKVKEEGETYLVLEEGWYDAKLDRDHIIVDKNMDGKVIAYAFAQALEPIVVFNETEKY